MAREFCPHCMQELSDGGEFCIRCGGKIRWKAADHQIPAGTVLTSAERHSFLFGAAKGEGGFGITYIGKELNSGRIVAIKEYFPLRCQPHRGERLEVLPAADTEKLYLRGKHSFLSEASMIRAVSHLPCIVHVLDFFEANNTAYMVMNYLDGVTLRHIMETRNRMDPEELLQKALPLMADLAQLHRAGVIHRDIAPDNLMLMPDGSLVLLDFGCARSMEDGRSMTVVLKHGFAPIEQYQTRGQGPCTDIYALCASLYCCITGQIPPAAPERLCAVVEDGADPLIAPSRMGVEMDGELERLLLWGLELQPTARPGTVDDLAARLKRRLWDLEREREIVVPQPVPEPVQPVETDFVRDVRRVRKAPSFGTRLRGWLQRCVDRNGWLLLAVACGISLLLLLILIRVLIAV